MTFNIMCNSVINAWYRCAHVKSLPLHLLDWPEYNMHMPIDLIPQEFIHLYDLAPKVKNGYIYMKII